VIKIDNGVNAINYTVNGITASFVKGGTGAITFVQGDGRTLTAVNGTLVWDGEINSRVEIHSFGNNDFIFYQADSISTLQKVVENGSSLEFDSGNSAGGIMEGTANNRLTWFDHASGTQSGGFEADPSRFNAQHFVNNIGVAQLKLENGEVLLSRSNYSVSPLKVSTVKINYPTNNTNFIFPAKNTDGDYIVATLEDLNLQKQVIADYAIADSDNNYTIFFNSATPITVTINTLTKENFSCDFYNLGAGAVTFVNGTATVGYPDGTILNTDKVCALIRFMATTTYKLKGELA
jgi:hypothetical protein